MRPAVPTRVPAVVDALLELYRTIPDLTVCDGPNANTPDTTCLEVGVGEPAVLVSSERVKGLRVAYVETVSVVHSLWSWSGSIEMKPLRDRCYAVLSEVDGLLREHAVRGDVWDAVQLGDDMEWQQGLVESGAACSVGFVVTARSTI